MSKDLLMKKVGEELLEVNEVTIIDMNKLVNRGNIEVLSAKILEQCREDWKENHVKNDHKNVVINLTAQKLVSTFKLLLNTCLMMVLLNSVFPLSTHCLTVAQLYIVIK